MGAEHGAYCLGCCWGLMLALFALGVMSLFWMAVVAAVIFAEKLLPGRRRLARRASRSPRRPRLWVAAAPGSVPGLVQPNSPGADRARMRMMEARRRGAVEDPMSPMAPMTPTTPTPMAPQPQPMNTMDDN